MQVNDRPQSLALPPAIAVPDFDPGHRLSARVTPNPPHPYRSAFQRDIGRILHAKAFRRLAGKTQVFTRRGAKAITLAAASPTPSK
jgi:dGTPase